MFKDNPEGQTHSDNDGCGMVEHNHPMSLSTQYQEAFDKFDEQISNVTGMLTSDSLLIKGFIETNFLPKSFIQEEIEKLKKDENVPEDIYCMNCDGKCVLPQVAKSSNQTLNKLSSSLGLTK